MAHNLTSFLFTPISIHLMLLFIGCSTSFRLLLHFNTSHVTVYQVEIAGKKYTWTHFNTSHVTVYQSFRTIMIRLRRHFNTSHVTVYHLTVDFNDSDIILFQYISCYCLSIRRTDFIAGGYISIHLMLLFIAEIVLIRSPPSSFQYISCYCLSP